MYTESELLDELTTYPSNAVHVRLLREQVCSRGGLTPYIGAGLSTESGLPTWTAFLRGMTTNERDLGQVNDLLSHGEYEKAATVIEDALTPLVFQNQFESVFGSKPPEIRGAVRLLPALFPDGPIVTTNFDDVLQSVYEEAGIPFADVIVGGHGESMVERTISQAEHNLIKLHGHAHERSGRVITAADYDSSYGEDDLLRRVLGTIVGRPLLFLGASLNQDRTVRMMDAARRGGGALTKHFALLEEGAEDDFEGRSRALTELGIQPIWFPKSRFDVIGHTLEYLAAELSRSGRPSAGARPPAPPQRRLHVPPLPRRALAERRHVTDECVDQLLSGRDVGLWHPLPGAGKTTLAVKVATDPRLEARYPDGTLWVTLGRTPTRVDEQLRAWGAFVGMTGVELDGASTAGNLRTEVASRIATRSMLIVLDDVWHAADSGSLRLGGPQCAYLVTSRFKGTIVDLVDEPTELSDLSTQEALALLAVPDVLAAHEAQLLALVDRYRSWPLGLVITGRLLRSKRSRAQLDAAFDRIDELLLDRQFVDDVPHDPSAADPTAVPQTIAGAIELSEDLLTMESKDALRELTVFPPKRNTFSRSASGQVTGSDDLVDDLLDHEFIEVVDADHDRYTMHGLIRSYARAHDPLDAQGTEDAHRRLRSSLIACVDAAEDHDAVTKTAVLEAERDNVAAALEWCVQTGNARDGLELARHLNVYWYETGQFSLGRSWLVRLLGLPGADDVPAKERALALNNAGNHSYEQSDFSAAASYYDEALQVRRAVGDEEGVAGTLNNIGLLRRVAGRYTEADRLLVEALDANLAAGRDKWRAINLNNLGICQAEQGRAVEAERFQHDSLALFDSLAETDGQGATWGRAMALCDLGTARILHGKVTDALEPLRTSLRLRVDLSNAKGIAASLRALAWQAHGDGRMESADELFSGSLVWSMQAGDRAGVVESLEGIGTSAIEMGTGLPGIALIDTAARERERIGLPRPRRLDVVAVAREEAAGRLDDLTATPHPPGAHGLDEIAHRLLENAGMTEQRARDIATAAAHSTG